MTGGEATNGVPVSPSQDTLPAGLYNRPIENLRPLRVVVIGAGFSGIYCGVRIPQRLRNIDLCIYDKNAGVGGTWFENRYPGCACDIPSHSYQYTFAPNPHWTSIYAPAKEILSYLQGVADKFSVHRFVRLSHEVKAAEWQNETSKWQLKIQDLETGQVFLDEADVVVNAKGLLNTIKWPDIENFDQLKIPTMHSANWDETQKFEGKRVGVIGSGSSSIQIVPALQKLKDIHLTCFVRSKTWIARPFADTVMKDLEVDSYNFSPEQRERFASDPEHYLKFRTIIERDANSIHSLTLQGSSLQKEVREGFTSMMREKLASKPDILKSILPDFSVGCRRLTPGPGYLEALVSDNVDFVDTHISRAHEAGLELVDGRKLDFDILVCATGFDAATAPPFPVVGVNGQTLQERFSHFPETYLSIATDGFPNFFMMFGPNGGIGTGPLTTILEAAGDYIIKSIRKMQKDNIKKMEVKQRRVQDFVQYMDKYFKKTVYMDDCQTWYRKNNRVTVLWPGSALHAMETFRSPRWEDWDYVYEYEKEDGEEVNRMGWLGDGWSLLQVDSEAGDLAYFLQPGQVDIPEGPLPERTAANRQRPYAY